MQQKLMINDKEHDPYTYVGDYFTLSFMKGDKSPVAAYNGLRGRLLGFNRRIKPVMSHEVNGLVKEPGLYEILGDPLLRLEIDRVVNIPIINLTPENYRFTDSLPKNQLFLAESRKHKFISELPFIPYNIGDKVLISQHSRYQTDFVSEI